eukprot:g48977.t1
MSCDSNCRRDPLYQAQRLLHIFLQNRKAAHSSNNTCVTCGSRCASPFEVVVWEKEVLVQSEERVRTANTIWWAGSKSCVASGVRMALTS